MRHKVRIRKYSYYHKGLKSSHREKEHVSLSSDTLLAGDLCVHVCSRCCAEFSALSDLEQHQTDCCRNSSVLTMNEGKGLQLVSLPDRTAEADSVYNAPSKHRNKKFMDCFSSRRSAESPESSSSDQSTSCSECFTDAVLCTLDFPEYFPQPDCSADPGENSWMKSKLIIENLERTKVAVAQFSDDHSKTEVLSLLQQLLALQIQQIHQLQLLDQIRHQVLLFAAHQAEIPKTLLICTKDLFSSNSTNQLMALSAYLSQKLAAAAGLAKCLSNQAANIGDFTQFTATEQQLVRDKPPESSQTFSKPIMTAVQERSNSHYMDCGSFHPKVAPSFLSQTKMSSLMLSSNCFNSKNLPKPSSNIKDSNSIPQTSAIVEDMDVMAALAQQRKRKKTSTPTLSSKESLLKCRYCRKVFGNDSALQIHLWSHIGERAYKCKVCGNRFSTQENLKVHFQRHKERYPHIQMNPYLVPEHLDSAGFSFGLSLSPEKAAARWLDMLPSPMTMTSDFLEQSDSTNLSSVVMKEENLISVPLPLTQGDLYFDSAASRSKENPIKTSDSGEPWQQKTMKTEDVKPTLNFSKMVTTKSKESVTNIPNLFTNPNSTSYSGFLKFRRPEISKLQLPSDTTDKRMANPNGCVICHRTFSCQSALKMHNRTHTGQRPYQCKLCGRAFTTKGNLKTHQAVHCATVPLRVQHSCPICQRRFTNAVVLQQHVHMHMEGVLPNAELTNQKYSVDSNGFRDTTKLNHRKNILEDGDFCDKRLSGFRSISLHLSPSPFDANKKTSYCRSHGELKLQWIKTEKAEGSNKITNQWAADQWSSTFPISDSLASRQSLSPNGQASMYFKTVGLNKPFHRWLDSTTLTLHASATLPTGLNFFNHDEDFPSCIHNLREKGVMRNNYCDICGKVFACQSALDIHYRSHTKERPFICTRCNRGFSTKGNLKQHMLTHQMRDFPSHLFEPTKPTQIPKHTCSMLSMGSPTVKTEMTALLNSSFRNGNNLSGSSQSCSVPQSPVHAVAPPRRMPKQHHCKTCGKSFSSSSALQIHERTHTGERPFACAVCGRAFTTKGNLKVHMGTHMWNSTPSKRGRRLSVDRSSVGFRTRPVKLPEPSWTNPAMVCNSRDSVFHWNQSPEPFSAGFNMNNVFQSGKMSFPSGHLEDTPEDKHSCLSE